MRTCHSVDLEHADGELLFLFIHSEIFDLFSLQRDQVFAQDQVALIIEQLGLVYILEVLELSKYVLSHINFNDYNFTNIY